MAAFQYTALDKSGKTTKGIIDADDAKAARALLEQKVGERKLSDKQMKSLFKKWYRMEEQHGDEDTMEHVKDSARNFVEQSSK